MRKILLTFLISAVMTAAIAYLSYVIKGEMGVRLLEVRNYPSELIAVVRNDGKANANVRFYELLKKADNRLGERWNQISLCDLNVTLKPGDTKNISLSISSIPDSSKAFMVRLFVVNNTRGQYSLDWESDN